MLLLVDDEYSVIILSCLSYMILTLVWTSPISNVVPANPDDFRLIFHPTDPTRAVIEPNSVYHLKS